MAIQANYPENQSNTSSLPYQIPKYLLHCFFDFHENIWNTDTLMLISSKATDTIYQAVLHLLEQQGIMENEPLQQHVLLRDGLFIGYRFHAATVHVDWLAQHDILVLKNQDRILLQKQLLPQKSSEIELSARAS